MATLERYWYLFDAQDERIFWARSINWRSEMDWQQSIPDFGMHLHCKDIHILNAWLDLIRYLPTIYDGIIMIMTYSLY